MLCMCVCVTVSVFACKSTLCVHVCFNIYFACVRACEFEIVSLSSSKWMETFLNCIKFKSSNTIYFQPRKLISTG